MKKEQLDKQVTELEAGNSGEYKVEAIFDSFVYASELELDQLSGLYYLIALKNYPKKKNIWKPLSAVQHLKKLISCFYKEHSEKPTATSPPIDSTPSMARPTVKPTPFTQKRGRPAGNASKQAKNWVLDACDN